MTFLLIYEVHIQVLDFTDLRNEGYTRLFNLLDYAEWQCKPQPWCLLYTQLGHCKQRYVRETNITANTLDKVGQSVVHY